MGEWAQLQFLLVRRMALENVLERKEKSMCSPHDSIVGGSSIVDCVVEILPESRERATLSSLSAFRPVGGKLIFLCLGGRWLMCGDKRRQCLCNTSSRRGGKKKAEEGNRRMVLHRKPSHSMTSEIKNLRRQWKHFDMLQRAVLNFNYFNERFSLQGEKGPACDLNL